MPKFYHASRSRVEQSLQAAVDQKAGRDGHFFSWPEKGGTDLIWLREAMGQSVKLLWPAQDPPMHTGKMLRMDNVARGGFWTDTNRVMISFSSAYSLAVLSSRSTIYTLNNCHHEFQKVEPTSVLFRTQYNLLRAKQTN